MKILKISLIVMLLLMLSAQSFPETDPKQIAITRLSSEIDSLHIQIHKLKDEINELRNEILSINTKLYYLEFRNK